MYKRIYEEHMLDPWHTRAAPASGCYIKTCFSKSPKLACSGDGITVHRLVGEDATPVMVRERLYRGSTLIFDRWS